MHYYSTGGLGTAATVSQNAGVIGSMGSATATAVLGSLTANGGTVLGLTSSAVPIIGAGLMVATQLVQMLIKNSGCGQTCIETSSWANQAAAALQQVLDAYFALPAPRTEAQQAVAIANFNTIWGQLQQACGQPGTGNAGIRCITDRQAGACTWKQKYAPTYPGQPNIGECWNWFNGYLAPIQADPVVPDTVASTVSDASSSLDSILGMSSTSMVPLLLVAALVGLAVLG